MSLGIAVHTDSEGLRKIPNSPGANSTFKKKHKYHRTNIQNFKWIHRALFEITFSNIMLKYHFEVDTLVLCFDENCILNYMGNRIFSSVICEILNINILKSQKWKGLDRLVWNFGILTLVNSVWIRTGGIWNLSSYFSISVRGKSTNSFAIVNLKCKDTLELM